MNKRTVDNRAHTEKESEREREASGPSHLKINPLPSDANSLKESSKICHWSDEKLQTLHECLPESSWCQIKRNKLSYPHPSQLERVQNEWPDRTPRPPVLFLLFLSLSLRLTDSLYKAKKDTIACHFLRFFRTNLTLILTRTNTVIAGHWSTYLTLVKCVNEDALLTRSLSFSFLPSFLITIQLNENSTSGKCLYKMAQWFNWITVRSLSLSQSERDKCHTSYCYAATARRERERERV